MEDGRSISHEALEFLRFRAIELKQSGEKVEDIAKFFGVHPGSVSRWLGTYRRKGKNALKSKKATGRKTKLTKKEKLNIVECLKQPATEFGFETPLWTTKRVCLLIRKKTEKSLHHSNVWRMLQRMGLSNQKPERRAIEQNPAEAQRWLEEEWPKIQEHAKRWQAIIYFQDETSVSLIPVLGKTWSEKGKTPIIRVTGNRGKIILSSAISPGGRLLFRIEKKNVNSKIFIDFLKKILKHHPSRKIIVVTDQAPFHTANAVGGFVEKNGKRLALYYLPPYSPELNADEYVNEYLKNKKLKAHSATSVGELRTITKASMHSIQKKSLLIQSFFHKLI